MRSIATQIPATGRTALAIFASISLLLSLLVAVGPASAIDGTQLNPSHVGTSWDDGEQNAQCSPEDLGLIAEGEVLWHFVLTDPSADEAVLTAEFETAGTVIMEDADKSSTTLHFYVVTGPDTLLGASTDISGGNLNLSHICSNVTVEEPPAGGDQGSLKVRKVDEDDNRLADATFTVEGQTGTFTTDANGEFCITGLPVGDVLTVTETAPPPGYEIVGEASQEVPVDPDGDCDSPEATFVNRLAAAGEEGGSLEIRVETDPDGSTESFAFEASYDADGFALTDGGTTGPTDLDPGDYTVAELLTQAQIDAGWSLTGIECTENGDAVVDLATGSVTVTVDDGDAIVCTFVNVLEQAGGEEGGSLEIRVETDPDGSTESFAFAASYVAAGFALTDGGAFGPTDLALGDHTVAEVLTQAQIDAGWSLTAIDCSENGDAIVDLATGSVTVTIDDGDAVVCTFENELAGQGTLGGTPRPTAREGTAGGVPDTANPTPNSGSPIAILVALAMLFGLSVTTLAAARARAR